MNCKKDSIANIVSEFAHCCLFILDIWDLKESYFKITDIFLWNNISFFSSLFKKIF